MQVDESSSLRQLARAIGPNETAPVTESVASTEETAHKEEAQKSLH
jgi:hypothetical protein